MTGQREHKNQNSSANYVVIPRAVIATLPLIIKFSLSVIVLTIKVITGYYAEEHQYWVCTRDGRGKFIQDTLFDKKTEAKKKRRKDHE